MTAARVVGAASPSRLSPTFPIQGRTNPIFHSPPLPTTSETPSLLQYDSDGYNTPPNTQGGNGEGVTENSEVPQEPQIISNMGGIVKFTVQGDRMKTLHDKLNPKVVMNKVDVKRVESIEL